MTNRQAFSVCWCLTVVAIVAPEASVTSGKVYEYTIQPLGRNRRSISANNTVHHSASYPSRIVLPIAPR